MLELVQCRANRPAIHLPAKEHVEQSQEAVREIDYGSRCCLNLDNIFFPEGGDQVFASAKVSSKTRTTQSGRSSNVLKRRSQSLSLEDFTSCCKKRGAVPCNVLP